MALQVKCGYEPITDGNLGSVDVGFQPDVVIILRTRDSDILFGTQHFSFGVCTPSSQWCYCATRTTTTSSAYRRLQTGASLMALSTTGTVAMSVVLTITATGFNYHASPYSAGVTIGYLAIKGGQWFAGIDTIDSASHTVTGIPFQPEGLILKYLSSTIANDSRSTAAVYAGFSDASLSQGGVSGRSSHITATHQNTVSSSQAALVVPESDTQTIREQISVSSYEVNGFTLNQDIGTPNNLYFGYLAFRDVGEIYFGELTEPSTSISGLPLTPEVILFMAGVNTTNDIVEARMNFGMGMTDGVSNVASMAKDYPSLQPGRRETPNHCITMITPQATNAVESDAACTGFVSGGFNLNWTTQSVNANIVKYLAIGEPSAASTYDPLMLGRPF